jgi:hypothetical protein
MTATLPPASIAATRPDLIKLADDLRIIGDVERDEYCFLSILLYAYKDVQFRDTSERCLKWGVISGGRTTLYSDYHRFLLCELRLIPRVVARVYRPGERAYMVGLGELELWRRHSRSNARRALTRLVDALRARRATSPKGAQVESRNASSADSQSPDVVRFERSPFQRRYEQSQKCLVEIVAPAIVRHKLIPGVREVVVVDGLRRLPSGQDSAERKLDTLAFIDAVAVVSNALVGISFKRSAGTPVRESTAISISVRATREGNALLSDTGDTLLPNFIVSAIGAGDDVSAICVVKRWIVADLLAIAVRSLRISGRELGEIPLHSKVLVGGCVLYRSSSVHVAAFVPWSLFLSYGDDSTRVFRLDRSGQGRIDRS